MRPEIIYHGGGGEAWKFISLTFRVSSQWGEEEKEKIFFICLPRPD